MGPVPLATQIPVIRHHIEDALGVLPRQVG
jgi:hypothetical protein